MADEPRIQTEASEPKGSVPEGLANKLAGGAIGLLIAAFLISSSMDRCSGAAEGPEPNIPAQAPPLASPGTPAKASEGIEAAVEEQRQRAADAQHRLQEREQARRDALVQAQRDAVAGATAEDQAVADAKAQIAAQEVMRRYQSLRTSPVALSMRAPATAPAEKPSAPTPPAAAVPEDDGSEALTAALVAAVVGGRAAAEPAPVPAPPPAPVAVTRPVDPQDPPGWERIYEGQFLEAVLVTQLRGDLPGPVAAMVASPLRSRDRQRVLVPVGSRILGTAQGVAGPDQARLAVGFHRLIFPDGRWIDLRFAGLAQAGESGLKDRVNRHYLSTFGAAGAIGVLSGFALSGDAGYGYGGGSIRAGLGRAAADSGMQVLDRYLSRLPTITIRAGHRVRVWFTSDALVASASE